MAFSESLFLFEMRVEDIKSYIDAKLFRIRTQFGDIFTLHLRDPNDGFPGGSPKSGKKRKELTGPIPTVQTVMVSATINSLELHFERYPLYLCAWAKGNPYSLGSMHLPWSPKYIDYLESLKRLENPDPVLVKGQYSIISEYNSKIMATIWLSIKLTRMAENVQNKVEPFRSTPLTPSFTVYNEDPVTNVDIYDKPITDDIGVIRTVYGGDNRLVKHTHLKKTEKVGAHFTKNTAKREHEKTSTIETKQTIIETDASNSNTKEEKIKLDVIRHNQDKTNKSSILKLVRSNTEIYVQSNDLIISKSCSSIQAKEHINIYDYIFAGNNGPFANNVYCVGYCAVKNDTPPKNSSSKTSTNNNMITDSLPCQNKNSSKTSSPTQKSQVSIKSLKHVPYCDPKASENELKYSLKICGGDCERQEEIKQRFQNTSSIDFPEKAGHMIEMTKCLNQMCAYKENVIPPEVEDKIMINMKNFNEKCCSIKKVEEIVGGIKMEMNADDPCYCKCDCKFGIRRTTYCTVCGGYEVPGDPKTDPPYTFPCPIFHKIERKPKEKVPEKKKKRSRGSSLDSEKAENRTDERFKFNYGYKGIPPLIGHSQCCMPCGGRSGNVPHRMGWLWTASNVPGLKFRPNWRPGAANKHVVRMLRIAKNPEQVKKKLKKKVVVKRPLKRPLLVVEKKDGEYTVTMENMKNFNNPRPPHVYPYEEKPVLTFTVGRTEEENALRAKRKARRKANLELEKRQFIQSRFQNLCKDICYKTYLQALGISPGDEDPLCPCLPEDPGPDRVDLERACSCSDQGLSSDATATDDDEWLVEFTPPNALYDPTLNRERSKMVTQNKESAETQYNYLDFAVKLVDMYGIPVPRFFIGPDGKQQCSDLGGFWGPDNKWLEINEDGYVAPDGRWAPNSFLGPNGEVVDAHDGMFQVSSDTWLTVGIDGYVENGKWRKYPMPRPMPEKMKKMLKPKKDALEKENPPTNVVNKAKQSEVRASETTWSCFGDANPKELSKMGIYGHGHDRKLLLSTLQKLINQGDNNIKMPHYLRKSRTQRKQKKVLTEEKYHNDSFEQWKCRHPPPSDKGVHAINEYGRKTYFRLKDPKNLRPRDRMNALNEKGIDLSSFHVPCLSSFIDSEIARQQKIQHIMNHNAKIMKRTAN